MACQLARVDAADRHCFRFNQVIAQALRTSEVGRNQWQILDDETRNIDLAGFHVLRIDAVIANVWIGEGDDLLAVGRVSQNLLISSHCRIKNHFSRFKHWRTDGYTFKNSTIDERKYCARAGTCIQYRQGKLQF